VSLRNAFAHLTAIRVPPRTRVPLSHSVHYFPWLGAAIGSLNILAFIAVSGVLPAPAACLFAVLFPQALAGFLPSRGIIEATQGIRTAPGHGFLPGFHPDIRGLGVVFVLLLAKWTALVMLPPDWQVRAVFVFPILGTCARTWAFVREPLTARAGGHLIRRRRIRAGFLVALMLFLVFLFPLRAALSVLVATTVTAALTLRLRHPARHPTRSPTRKGGLTLQSAAVVSEATETAVLAGLVFAGLVLFR
jgi:cobalamin synthase